MPVYVDKSNHKLGRMITCHMLADTLVELHAMADKIGMSREWFQNKPGKVPHYDVSKARRVLALQNGAKEADRKKVVALIRKWKAGRKMKIQKRSACPCGHERYGYKIKDRVLTRQAKKSLHMLRQPPAWCIQKRILDKHRQEIAEIVIEESETGSRYRVGIDSFMKHAQPLERKAGEQYMLPLEFWRVENAKSGQLELFGNEQAKA